MIDACRLRRAERYKACVDDMPFDCPSARGRRGQCVICSRLWIDYIGRIHKAREIRCNLSKTVQSD